MRWLYRWLVGTRMLLQRGRDFSPAAARTPLVAATAGLALLAIAGAFAPHWIAFAQRLEFEVASVKVSDTNQDFEFRPRRTGDRVSIHMTHIANVITYAYHIPYYRVINYDKSPIAYDWYDIDAKTNGRADDDQVRLMFQSLLEDRFQFKMHRETREMPEYVITLAKAKSKMTPASSGDLMKFEIEGRPRTWPKGRCGITSWRSGLRLICHAAPAREIVSAITGYLGAPVADQTGITGTYDILLRFQDDRRPPDAEPGPPDAEPAPPLASALNAELGLKLEKGKGPVEVLVIDRLTKPAEN